MLTPNKLFGVYSVNKGHTNVLYNQKPFSTHYFSIEDTLNRIFTPTTQKRDIRDYVVCCERVKLFCILFPFTLNENIVVHLSTIVN